MPAMAPGPLARFHHTPKVSGKNRPEQAKQNAQATAPRMPVSCIEAISAADTPIITSSTRATISRTLVSALGSIIL